MQYDFYLAVLKWVVEQVNDDDEIGNGKGGRGNSGNGLNGTLGPTDGTPDHGQQLEQFNQPRFEADVP